MPRMLILSVPWVCLHLEISCKRLTMHQSLICPVFYTDSAKILQGEWWRLLTGHVTFGTTGELVMGTITLAHFARRFERELGSRKFCMWLLESYILSVVLIWTVATTVMRVPLQYAGPYSTLGALLYLYYRYTPRLHPRFFGMFGFSVSEKVIPYAFCIQVILFRGKHTIVPALCGFLAGWWSILYTADVPDVVATSAQKCFSMVTEAPPPLVAPATARRQQYRRPAAPAAPRPTPPSQANIDQLCAMGFDRDTVVRALQQSNNNVERALDRLLTGAG